MRFHKIRILKNVVLPLLTVIIILSSTQIIKAAGGTVDAATVTANYNTVTVEGTVATTPTVYAVAVVAYDSNGILQSMFSTDVTSNAFSASFTLPAGEYTIKVADYDGGTYFGAGTVTVTNPPAPPTPAGDAGSASNSTPTPQVAPTAEVEPVVPVAETPVQTVSPKTNDGMGILVALAAVALIAYTGYFVKRRA